MLAASGDRYIFSCKFDSFVCDRLFPNLLLFFVRAPATHRNDCIAAANVAQEPLERGCGSPFHKDVRISVGDRDQAGKADRAEERMPQAVMTYTLADGSEVVIAADEGVICFDGRYRCPKGSSGKLFYHMVQDFVEGRD